MIGTCLMDCLGGHGDVLVTSRSRDLDRLGSLLEIPSLTTDEGVKLLLRRHRGQDVEKYVVEASRIVARLGGLALAIDQAAAYIGYMRIPLDQLADFLITYEEQRGKILQYTPAHFWEYETMQIHGEAEKNKALSAFTT